MSTATAATTIAPREVRMAARPDGEPKPDGEVLVRNTHLSVDPYMRGRMDDAESYIAYRGDYLGKMVVRLED